MSVTEDLTNAVMGLDHPVRMTTSVWLALLKQSSQSRTPHLLIALDAMELIDGRLLDEANDTLVRDMGSMWPTCIAEFEEAFCPRCASVQSAMFVFGVAPEVEQVRQHLLLLKNRDRAVAEGLMTRIYESWNADESEAGYTLVVDGPGFLAFTEQV